MLTYAHVCLVEELYDKKAILIAPSERLTSALITRPSFCAQIHAVLFSMSLSFSFFCAQVNKIGINDPRRQSSNLSFFLSFCVLAQVHKRGIKRPASTDLYALLAADMLY